uniref:Uncharacterized protein n=1 Tax=Anguilla anguilla TaxID=7936 RepID=A0A0E9WDX0_ANGAN
MGEGAGGLDPTSTTRGGPRQNKSHLLKKLSDTQGPMCQNANHYKPIQTRTCGGGVYSLIITHNNQNLLMLRQ